MPEEPVEMPGLTVRLLGLEHRREPAQNESGFADVFIYHLLIRNDADRRATLLARRWIIREEGGETQIIEGDGIVGETPTLLPGQEFAYKSFHVARCPSSVEGSFHGVDEQGARIFAKIPSFEMRPPESADE